VRETGRGRTVNRVGCRAFFGEVRLDAHTPHHGAASGGRAGVRLDFARPARLRRRCIVRKVGTSVSSPPAALSNAPDLSVLAVLAGESRQTRKVVSTLGASGVAVATVFVEKWMPGTAEDVDAVVVCGASPSEASRVAGEVRQVDASVRIVVVVHSASPRELRALLGSGVDGIVTDATAGEALVVTLHAVCAGQLVIPGELWQRVARPLLSTREKQVLAMVVMGFSNAEIARKLFVTEATIKSHLSSVFAKLGVRSRTEATARILDPEHGLGTGILAISDDGRSDG
jgi:DNA-binding NarL/FixJ family response regulator